MSVENLKEYARRCASEPELAAEAKAIGLEDLEGQMRHAGSLGLAWGEDDLAAFRSEVTNAEGEIEDISEDELSKVAGGLVTVTAAVVGAAVAGGAAAGAVVGVAAGGATTATGSGSW